MVGYQVKILYSTGQERQCLEEQVLAGAGPSCFPDSPFSLLTLDPMYSAWIYGVGQRSVLQKG